MGSSASCFLNYPEFIDNPSRWGWTNGPLATGNYTMTLWAGAGQCNTGNDTNVGTLSVNYSGSSAVITYNVVAPYSLTEVHLYAGCEVLPQVQNGPNAGQYTLAPGQYPIKAETLAAGLTTWSYTVNNLSCSNGIYVVAHAKVKGFICVMD